MQRYVQRKLGTCVNSRYGPYTTDMGKTGKLLLLGTGLTGIYLALGWIALLTTGPNEVTLMWPATGIVYAALLFFGPRWWPLPVVSVLLLHLTVSPVPLSFIPWSIAGNVAGVLAGAWFVRRFVPELFKRFDVATGAGVLTGGIVLAVTSACFGSLGMLLSGQSQIDSLMTDAVRWAFGDIFGIIAVTPAVLLGLQRLYRPAGPMITERGVASFAEQRIWLGLTALVVLSATWMRSAEPNQALAMVGLPLATMIWGAVRLPPLTVAIVNGVISLLIVAAINLGFVGPAPGSTTAAISLVAFLCVVAAIPMTLSLGTQQSRQATANTLQRANTDALTGLLNRSAFEYHVRREIEESPETPMALAYIDLDRFRLINDATDHAVGDQLIQIVAGILRSKVPTGDLLARIGGDEFAILMRDVTPDQALVNAESLCDAVADCRFQAGEHVATPTISIGLVHAEINSSRHFGSLLALADTSCFTAKEHGGNRVQRGEVGARGSVQRSSETMRWALRLGNAMERDHFQLFCQTITPLHAGGPQGLRHFEVLLRLKEPGADIVLPSEFIDAAERYALSVRLDRYVLNKVLRWFERHPEHAREVGLCAINLSAGSLQDEHFLNDLATRVLKSNLRPEQLCFELTETSALRDLGRAQRFIRAVRALGCRFALDDFGTGFCSFGYLQSLDVDFFKIDGSFVRDIESSALSFAIVRSIADIGRVMRKQTIAECVESDAVCQRLRDLGVDFGQGFALGRPTEISSFFATRGRADGPPQTYASASIARTPVA